MPKIERFLFFTRRAIYLSRTNNEYLFTKFINMRAASTVRIEILYGIRDMLPMSLAAATYGLAFGLLASQSGFNNFQAISMSALVFGGSSQLVAMDQLVLGVGPAAAMLAGAALNMRILLITASTLQREGNMCVVRLSHLFAGIFCTSQIATDIGSMRPWPAISPRGQNQIAVATMQIYE